MNQKDLTTIGGVIILAIILSYFISNKIFVTSTNREQAVETGSTIKASFTPPSSKYFSSQSIDPTQLIQTGNNSNTTPFGNATAIQ
jgi:hypothetical protein